MQRTDYKICTRCHTYKSLEDYSKNYTFCKECKKKSYYKNKHWKKNSNDNKMKRYHNDKLYKEKILLRRKLNDSWKYNHWTDKSIIKKLLCVKSKEEFVMHIKTQFKEGMTLENYGKGENKWNFDHIKPLSLAENIEQLHKLFHYKNTQPLWSKENNKKRAKQ